jgi:predicted phosphodiesterase
VKYAILSDIHANVTSLKAVLTYIDTKYVEQEVKFILLGDFINYGPRPNETIEILKRLNLFAVIIGNHEDSLIHNEYSRFSSQRGIDSLKYTDSLLNPESKAFIELNKLGVKEIVVENKKVLLVHGDLTDIFWGKMTRAEMEKEIYSSFDFVFSGHTHIPFFSEIFYDSHRQQYRFKKKTIFVNPGSLGQPRNHNNMAQFCIVDFSSESLYFEKVSYDIKLESTYYSDHIDPFYKKRLKLGV